MTIWQLLSILCFIYFLFLYSKRLGTKFFYIWLLLGMVFIEVNHISVTGESYFIPAKLISAAKILFTAGWICLFAAALFSLKGFFIRDKKITTDYLIILGAQVREDGPSRVLRFRIERAAEFLKEHPETTAIVSGGRGSNEPESEAAVMKRYLAEKGINEERIITEDQSRNTVENLRFSAKFLNKEKDTIAIITSNYHISRGIMLAKREGFVHVYGIPAKTTPAFLPLNMLREALSIIKAVVWRRL